MCGSLRHSAWNNTAPIKPGETFPIGTRLVINNSLVQGKIVWNKRPSHARSENISKWQGAWTEGALEIDSFTEQGVEFKAPGAIKVMTLQGARQTNLVVLTRNAETKEEQKVHDRYPVFAKVA